MRPPHGDDRLWEALGLDDVDVAVYHGLLHDPGQPVDASAEAFGESPKRIRARVVKLERLGLVEVTGDGVRVVRPSSALASLAHLRKSALERVQGAAIELDALFSASSAFARPVELFEVVRGGEAIVSRIRELVTGAAGSIDVIDTPPYVAAPNPALHDAETAAVARGVVIRSLVDHSALDDDAHVKDVLRSVSEGQQVRLSARLRTKMIVIDGSSVIIPLAAGLPFGQPHVAIISHREIVDALASYFESLFEVAVPFESERPVMQDSLGAPFTPQEEQVLQLLSGGLSDRSVATTLGISERTLRRRINSVEEKLGARGRFQLGQLVERGRAQRHRGSETG